MNGFTLPCHQTWAAGKSPLTSKKLEVFVAGLAGKIMGNSMVDFPVVAMLDTRRVSWLAKDGHG